MKASEVQTFNKTIAVVGYDKFGKLIMWGVAKNYDVIAIELTDQTLKVFVDYESRA